LIVAIHQPQYLPWLGYFDKIDRADVLCLLDNVQYKKNEWQNRNRIKTAQGVQWMTVPVQFRFPQKINEVQISEKQRWQHKHLQALITNYSKARCFDEVIGFFEDVYQQSWTYLSSLNIHAIKGICKLLNVDKTEICISSQMTLREGPTDRLIDICKHVGGDTYLAGQAGADYMDLEKFKENNIKVLFQKYAHPAYPQLFGEFQSHLSIIDLLMNCGSDSLEVIRGVAPEPK